jgi:hypothetical protein
MGGAALLGLSEHFVPEEVRGFTHVQKKLDALSPPSHERSDATR